MAKTRGGQTIRLPSDMIGSLKMRMDKDHRYMAISGYVHEIIRNYLNGVLIDYEKEKPRLELELLNAHLKGRTVTGVGTIRPVIERDEGKRKAAS